MRKIVDFFSINFKYYLLSLLSIVFVKTITDLNFWQETGVIFLFLVIVLLSEEIIISQVEEIDKHEADIINMKAKLDVLDQKIRLLQGNVYRLEDTVYPDKE